MSTNTPRVMVLDGDFDNAIQVATEVSTDLDATVIGVGTTERSRLLCSRHCDVAATVAVSGDGYSEALLSAVREHRPDVVVPVGYDSMTAIDSVRDRLPQDVNCCLPSSSSLATAVDKRRTLALASRLGIDTPADFTEAVAAAERSPDAVRDLPYPVFLKARHECGGNVTAVVQEPRSFWPTYDDLAETADDDVLVQEYIDDDRTYGCGVLFMDGSLQMLFEHEERRSVPRQGGSGTRVRIFRDPELEAASLELLRALDWNGFALAEFKRRPDGSFVLMEVNPKLWASYALASQSGYRFVSTMVVRSLDLPWREPVEPSQTGEMVFPLRELNFALTDANESLVRSGLSMLWPPARWDVNFRDFRSWFTPPAGDAAAERDSAEAGSGTSDERAVPAGANAEGSDRGDAADDASIPGFPHIHLRTDHE